MAPLASLRALLRAAALVGTVAASATTFAAPPSGSAPPAKAVARPAPLRIGALKHFSAQTLALPTGIPNTFQATMTFDGVPHTISASRFSMRGPEFQVYLDLGDGIPVPVEPPPYRTYRGTVDGLVGSSAAVSLIDGQLRGAISLGNGVTWWVQPASEFDATQPAANHVLYKGGDEVPMNVHCGNEDIDMGGPAPAGDGGIAGAQPQIAEIAFDADFEFFQKNGSSVTNTVNDIETVMNGVEFIYDRDVNIGYEFTTFVVRTVAADPYTTNVIEDLLCEFRTTWNASPENAIQRELAQLYTGKSLSTSSIGLAWLGAVCNQSANACGAFGNLAYSVVESRYTLVLSFRESLSAHEIGHNWNATHCDGDGDCHIMCSSNGGCDGIAGSDLKFGVGEVAEIVAYKNTVGCDATLPLPLTPPFTENFPNASIDTTHWTYVDGCATTQNATNEPSATRSLEMNASGSGPYDNDEIRSNTINLGGLTNVKASLFTEHKGVESGEKLTVEYWSSGGDWVALGDIVSNGVDQSVFTVTEYTLPANARHSGFRLRLRAQVNEPNDFWYVDNISVAEVTVPPPANDECNAAVVIPMGSTPFDTTNATDSFQVIPANCNEGGGTQFVKDLWYLVQATCTGTLTVSTCGTANFDTKLAAYSALNGCPQSGASVLACNDNNGGCPFGSSIMQLSVTQNFPYYIRLGGASVGGTGTLVIACTASAPCPSDLNGDDVVNASDLAILLGAWGGPGGDVNGDGTTNGADLATMLGAWGACP